MNSSNEQLVHTEKKHECQPNEHIICFEILFHLMHHFHMKTVI